MRYALHPQTRMLGWENQALSKVLTVQTQGPDSWSPHKISIVVSICHLSMTTPGWEVET